MPAPSAAACTGHAWNFAPNSPSVLNRTRRTQTRSGDAVSVELRPCAEGTGTACSTSRLPCGRSPWCQRLASGGFVCRRACILPMVDLSLVTTIGRADRSSTGLYVRSELSEHLGLARLRRRQRGFPAHPLVPQKEMLRMQRFLASMLILPPLVVNAARLPLVPARILDCVPHGLTAGRPSQADELPATPAPASSDPVTQEPSEKADVPNRVPLTRFESTRPDR